MAQPRADAPAFLITEQDHVEGAVAAPVTLVEYGDSLAPCNRR